MHAMGSSHELWTETKAWVAALDGVSAGLTAGDVSKMAALTTKMGSSGVLTFYELNDIIRCTMLALTRWEGTTD